ncbi:hypothetical protein Peur_015384 [Populus x canadensis]
MASCPHPNTSSWKVGLQWVTTHGLKGSDLEFERMLAFKELYYRDFGGFFCEKKESNYQGTKLTGLPMSPVQKHCIAASAMGNEHGPIFNGLGSRCQIKQSG